MATTLQLKRGDKSQLPSKAMAGEPLVALDTQELFIGDANGTPQKVSDFIMSDTAPDNVSKLWWNTITEELQRYNGSSWIKIYNDKTVCNPIIFGAKCNGTTDDTSAFQKALNYCRDNGGGVVFVPPGISMISSLVIPSYCGLVGNGRGSVIKQIANSTAPLISLETTLTKFTLLSNFSIDGNKANQTSSDAKGIYYNNVTTFKMEPKYGEWDCRHVADNIYIVNTKGIGFQTDGRGESHFSNIQVRGSDDYGMKLNAFDCWYDGLSSGDNAKTGIYITMGGHYINCKSWNNGNATDATDGYGWYINATSGSFVCCEAQGNYNDGFYFDNSSNCVGTGLVSDVNGQHATIVYPGKAGFRFNNSSIIAIQGTARNIGKNISQDYGVTISGWSTDNIIEVVCNNIPVKPFFMIDNPNNEGKNYLRITNGTNGTNVATNGKFNYVGINMSPNQALASLTVSGTTGSNLVSSFFQQIMDPTTHNDISAFQAIDSTNSSNSIKMNIGATITNNEIDITTSNNTRVNYKSPLKINGGVWNYPHLILGDQHVFFDSTGKMRIKYKDPTADTDGKEVVVLEQGVVNSFDAVKNNALGIGINPNTSISPLWVYNTTTTLTTLIQNVLPATSTDTNIMRIECIDSDNSVQPVRFNVGGNLSTNEIFIGSNTNNIRVNNNLKLQYGTWQYSHLLMGNYHVWVANDKLNIKNSAPTSDSDGNVVPRVVPVPTSNTAAGTIGDIAVDSNYYYVCIAKNTWKRIAFDTTW